MPPEDNTPTPAPVARRTPEERLAAVAKALKDMGSEVFYDLLLATAMGDPMLLIHALQDGANARVVDMTGSPVATEAVKPPTIN